MTTLAQRWRNVELATVSLCWLNGQNYLAPTSLIYVGPTVLLTLGQRWANGAAYVGPTLGQRSCAIWVGTLGMGYQKFKIFFRHLGIHVHALLD